jgi:hypothetical protein
MQVAVTDTLADVIVEIKIKRVWNFHYKGKNGIFQTAFCFTRQHSSLRPTCVINSQTCSRKEKWHGSYFKT